ncbi:MAG: hypothetical protein O7G87_22015, partial [bacterium]|nr:hypothetical protein [bacterium]
MINPFQEFKDRSVVPEKHIPLDEILVSHNSMMDGLTEGYKHLISDEVGEGVWREDGDSIIRIYDRAERLVRDLQWSAGDIEAFCLRSLQSDDPDFYLMGPLGLYVSALCNALKVDLVSMNLKGQELRLPLLGYRLRDGLTLKLEGNLGDLIGISLAGGHLMISGNVGRYLGAGMGGGRIDVDGDAGRF